MARTYRRIVTKESHHKNAIPYKRNKISFDIDDITIEIEKTPRNRRSY